MSLQVKKCKAGIRFPVNIQPRSSRNEITGIHNNALKIKLTSPPVEGEANRMCGKFLAKSLDVSPSRISIVSGAASRKKTIQIDGMDEETLRQKLKAFID